MQKLLNYIHDSGGNIAILAILATVLSGCAAFSGPKLTGDQQLELIRRFGEYGCGGTIRVDVEAGTGQLGGQASAGFHLDGRCPERDPRPPQPTPTP